MPILFRCDCGAYLMRPDEEAEKPFACEYCGANGVVPPTSDESCVLVYRDGFPDEGQVMGLEEFQRQINEFILRKNDLICYNGTWCPIGEVVEQMPSLPEAPEPEQPDIATTFEQLPPLPGFNSIANRYCNRKRAFQLKRLLRTVFGDPKARVKSKRRNFLQWCALWIPVLAILAIAYLYGVRKIVNYCLWRPAYVIVYNNEDSDCVVRLCGQELRIPSHNTATFQDIFVSSGGLKTLTVLSEASGTEIYSLKVPVYPSMDTLVNPGKKQTFYTFSVESSLLQWSRQDLCRALLDELRQGEPPNTIDLISEEARHRVQSVYQGSSNEEIYTSRQFDFSHLKIGRSTEYRQKMTKTAATALETKAAVTLVPSEACSISLGPVTCFFNPLKKWDDVKLTLRADGFLPFAKFIDSPAWKQVAPSTFTGTMTFTAEFTEDGGLVLKSSPIAGVKMVRHSSSYSYSQEGASPKRETKLTGNLNFTGQRNLQGQWTWQWNYFSRSEGVKLTIVSDRNGYGQENFDLNIGSKKRTRQSKRSRPKEPLHDRYQDGPQDGLQDGSQDGHLDGEEESNDRLSPVNMKLQ